MKWAVVAIRTIIGLTFFVTGLNGFLNFIPLPPPTTAEAGSFLGLLINSHYLYVVKVLETIGGVLLLSGRMPLLGLTLVTPVAVNILLYEIFLLHAPGPGLALVPLCTFLVYGYRSHFGPVFAVNPKIG